MQANTGIELFTKHTPPDLDRLFGYQHSKRWVTFFWGKLINQRASGYCFDGELFNPLNALAWDTFFGHPLVVAMNYKRINGHAVKRFDFGDMLQSSRHFLLLDRQKRHLHAAHKSCALQYLNTEMRSTNGGRMLSDFLNQDISRKSAEQVVPSSKGALQMIADMTVWLDERKLLLKQTGQWPKLG